MEPRFEVDSADRRANSSLKRTLNKNSSGVLCFLLHIAEFNKQFAFKEIQFCKQGSKK